MTGHFDIVIDGWRIMSAVGSLPNIYADYVNHAVLCEEFDLTNSEGDLCFLGVAEGTQPWPSIVIAQRYEPATSSGFHPGALIVPSTGTLFVGAGTRLLAYDLQIPRRKWQERTEVGFWSWSRHGAYVVMSAELELAAWTLEGAKLWSQFVEPPWEYVVLDNTVHLDVMGTNTSFSISSGP